MALAVENIDIPVKVHVASGLILVDGVSGQTISLTSGQTVMLTSGERILGLVRISGEQVALTSGQTVMLTSGERILGVVRVSGEQVALTSGQTVMLTSGERILGVVRVSGETVSTRPQGHSDTLFSGYGTTDSYVYSGANFLTHGKATIMIESIEAVSSVRYTIRGYPVSGLLVISLTSGTLLSGDQEVNTLTDPYEWVEVGLANLTSEISSAITVTMARR